MDNKEYFLAGRIYQYILTTAKKTEGEKVTIIFGVGEDYNLIELLQILEEVLSHNAVFVVQPLDHGCELTIHTNKKKL